MRLNGYFPPAVHSWGLIGVSLSLGIACDELVEGRFALVLEPLDEQAGVGWVGIPHF
jgi:hypothetical protein